MSRKLFSTCLSLVSVFLWCDGANILIISPTSMYSHHMTMLELWKGLYSRGHNITFSTPFVNDENIVNFTVIDTSKTLPLMQTKYHSKHISTISKWFVWNLYWELTHDSQSIILSSPEVQDIIQNPAKYKFDAVISELWHTNLFAISRIYKCPSIAYATIDLYEALHWHLGNQINHVTLPDLNMGLFEATNFFERLESALYTLHELYKEYFVYMPLQKVNLNRFFSKYLDITVKELKQDIDLVLVNSNPFLKGVRALGPTTVNVGGGLHLNPPKPLPKEFKDYLDGATNGFIYMSLGSNVRSKDLHSNVLEALTNVMDRLPYKILWKFEDDDLPFKTDNVKIVKWTPQQDVLRHPNIKLFISQGGVHSLEETIFSHVPILIMPFFGDQYKNGQLATSKGFGKMIEHKSYLDEAKMEAAIHDLIDDPKYKNTAIRLANLMSDTYMTGLEKSIWWIEYVIRNNGTKELRNPAAKLPFYQYYALDILGFILSIIVLCVIVLRKLFDLALSLCRQRTTKKPKYKKH